MHATFHPIITNNYQKLKIPNLATDIQKKKELKLNRTTTSYSRVNRVSNLRQTRKKSTA